MLQQSRYSRADQVVLNRPKSRCFVAQVSQRTVDTLLNGDRSKVFLICFGPCNHLCFDVAGLQSHNFDVLGTSTGETCLCTLTQVLDKDLRGRVGDLGAKWALSSKTGYSDDARLLSSAPPIREHWKHLLDECTNMIAVDVQHILQLLGLNCKKVATVADTSVQHEKTNVEILHLLQYFVIEGHVVCSRKVGDYDACLHPQTLQLILNHCFEFTLSA